jgi:hypothetical protein
MHLMVISGPDGKLVAAIKEMTGKKTTLFRRRGSEKVALRAVDPPN